MRADDNVLLFRRLPVKTENATLLTCSVSAPNFGTLDTKNSEGGWLLAREKHVYLMFA